MGNSKLLKFLVFFILSFLNPFYSIGQKPELNLTYYSLNMDSIYNYVANPSFEEFTECPVGPNQLDNAKHWSREVTFANSPEFFHRCLNILYNHSDLIVGVPKNFAGYQEPRTGSGYAGIVTFSSDHHKEYIQTELKKPLERGVEYIIGMYVSLANSSKYANDRFRFCITTDSRFEKRWRTSKGLSFDKAICPSGVLYKSDSLITDTINWVNIEVEYTARGGEKYLTIGVFAGDIKWWERIRKRRNIFNEDWDKFRYKTDAAYYYIDDVYVIRKEDYLKMKEYDEVE